MARILAVDDDPKILKILQHSLGRDGYEVSTASSGDEAVQQVKLHKPDLVILDIMMPGKDGFETFQEIKAQHNDIPVVILSASCSSDKWGGLLKFSPDIIIQPPLH
jgi:DNA-binding response OmpR family regulator